MGRFAVADRILDVAMALERMYVLDEGNIGRKLRSRTARFLRTDATSEQTNQGQCEGTLWRAIGHHSQSVAQVDAVERVHSAFIEGFDLARQSLFKLLREGAPENWAAATCNGSEGAGTNWEIKERSKATSCI